MAGLRNSSLIGVVIPDRNDRPELLKHCLWMLSRQTRQPDFIELVNHEPKSSDPDLTERVRIGFESLKAKGCECVFVIENDDYYSPDYIETMFKAWDHAGMPDLFGINYTYYYHVGKRMYSRIDHNNRSSLFCTLISYRASFGWCADNYVFLDLYLWGSTNGETFSPEENIAVGIKHGIGKCGGIGHTHFKYDHSDADFNWLSGMVDEKSFDFYSKMMPLPEPPKD